MAKQVEGPVLSGYAASAALGIYLRVKLDGSNQLALAGATDLNNEIGTTEKQAFAADERIPVRSRNAVGTKKMVAAGAYAARSVIYPAASGKISTTVSGEPIGLLLDASAADGDIVEVLPFNNANGGVGSGTAGLRLATGSAAALDGSNPTPIATGLATIVAAGVHLRGTAAPGDNTSVLTHDYSGADGTLNVYAWKNTGGTDPTLAASTGTETFDWWALGTG